METLSDSELEVLLDDIESECVEKKSRLTAGVRKKVQEAICAFANDFPNHNKVGVLFIGANDDGTPSGIDITEDLLNNLANIKTDGNILPPPAMTVQKRTLKGSDMAVVSVLPSSATPIKCDGRIWIRTGARRSIANEEEERVLIEKRRGKDIPFDISPVSRASLDDLSQHSFQHEYLPTAFAADIIAANSRTYEQQLAACKMITSADDPTPTVLGLLTIGISPQDFLYGAYVQFLRIDGTELSDPILDAAQIYGTLKDILKACEGKSDAHNLNAYDINSGAKHVISKDYPLTALKQILYNAVMHRSYEGTNTPVHFYWYNDRIEITSPGGLYGSITKADFKIPGRVDYRNPNIAKALRDLGYIEQFGVGIRTAQAEMKKNGNPLVKFEVNEANSFVNCTLKKAKEKKQ